MPSQVPQAQQSSPFEVVSPSKNKGGGGKGIAIVIALLLFLGLSIFLGVYLVQRNTNIAERAAPATAMYITPGSQSKSPGTDFSFSVNIDTSTNFVTGVDVRLTFDPSVIQIMSLQQGSGVINLDQTITNTYDNSAGTISYAIFTLASAKAVNGSSIEVLKVNAQVKTGAQSGSYNIAFDPVTAASASQEGQNVLVSKSQGTLIVTSGTGPFNPTPTPTQVGQVTPTPTPTQAGQVTPTPTSTAIVYATATPTFTPVATQATPMPIPETGTDWPTVLGIGFGLLTIIGAFVLAI